MPIRVRSLKAFKRLTSKILTPVIEKSCNFELTSGLVYSSKKHLMV